MSGQSSLPGLEAPLDESTWSNDLPPDSLVGGSDWIMKDKTKTPYNGSSYLIPKAPAITPIYYSQFFEKSKIYNQHDDEAKNRAMELYAYAKKGGKTQQWPGYGYLLTEKFCYDYAMTNNVLANSGNAKLKELFSKMLKERFAGGDGIDVKNTLRYQAGLYAYPEVLRDNMPRYGNPDLKEASDWEKFKSGIGVGYHAKRNYAFDTRNGYPVLFYPHLDIPPASAPPIYGDYKQGAYIPIRTWREIEKNITKQVLEATTPAQHDNTKPLIIHKPGEEPSPYDQESSNKQGGSGNPLEDATVDENATYDENAEFDDTATSLDLSKVGISKESIEITGVGALPFIYYGYTRQNYTPAILYSLLSPVTAFGITKLFHEPLDYNLREWNSTFDKNIRAVDVLEEEFEEVVKRLYDPRFFIPLTLAGIPVGYVYYRDRKPGILFLYAASFVGIPWAYSLVTRFIDKHKILLITVGGVTATMVGVGYLYYLNILPEVVLGYLAAGGLVLTGLTAIGVWIADGVESVEKKTNPLNWF